MATASNPIPATVAMIDRAANRIRRRALRFDIGLCTFALLRTKLSCVYCFIFESPNPQALSL